MVCTILYVLNVCYVNIKSEKYANKTINCIASILHAILNKAIEWEVIYQTCYCYITSAKNVKTNLSSFKSLVFKGLVC